MIELGLAWYARADYLYITYMTIVIGASLARLWTYAKCESELLQLPVNVDYSQVFKSNLPMINSFLYNTDC